MSKPEQGLKPLLWADGVVIPRSGGAEENVPGPRPVASFQVVGGSGPFTGPAVPTNGDGWVSIQIEGAGPTLTGCQINVSQDGVTWVQGALIQGPVGSSVTALSNVQGYWSAVRGAAFVQLTGQADAAINATVLMTTGTGPAFLFTLSSNVLPVVLETTTGLVIGSIAGTSADAVSAGTNQLLQVADYLRLFNGTNYDRARNNLDLTVLASAARTTAQDVAITNFNWSKLRIIVNVTANPGAGGLTPQLQQKDPISGAVVSIGTAAAAITGNGMFVYDYYPGAAGAVVGGVTAKFDVMLGRNLNFHMGVADASSYTYSVAAEPCL